MKPLKKQAWEEKGWECTYKNVFLEENEHLAIIL